MRLGRVNHNFHRGPAEAFLAIQSIYAAFPRTESAFFKNRVSFLDPLGEFTFFFQTDVGRMPWLLFWF